MNLTAILAIWAVAGPILVGGGMYASMTISNGLYTAAKVAATQMAEVTKCEARRAHDASMMSANVSAGIGAGASAAEQVGPTPPELAKLILICKAEPWACRSAGKLP